MRKTTFIRPFLVGLIALILMPLAANAQTPEAKILVVDFLAVNERSLVGQDVDAQLRQYQLALEGRATELQNEIKLEGETLVSQQSVLPPDVYQDQAIAYQQKVQRANTEIEGKRNLLLKAAQAAQLEINRVVRPIIDNIMRDRGATMVVDNQFIYASMGSTGIDITNEVITQLDIDLKNYAVRDPNQ